MMRTSRTPRAIRVWGTVTRASVGASLVGSVLYGHAARGWHPVAWLVGLLAFPALITAALWWRARRDPAPVRATSNWLLRRDDRVGCALFGVIDTGEAQRASPVAPAFGVGHGR